VAEETLTSESTDTPAPAQAIEYQPGELAPVIVTDTKVWQPKDLDATMKGVITKLFQSLTIADESARRYNVLETWEMRHFDRQHQYLRAEKGTGAWQIYGANSTAQNGNGIADADDRNLYATNVFSAQGDIATGALNRGKIKVKAAPRKSKNPADVAAADEANKYTYIWEKINSSLQSDMFDIGWTDCRSLVWTRTVADKRFGTGTDDAPQRRELSTVHGVLETKLPMMADTLKDSGYAMVFEEMDYAVARAAYPWMGKKIKPSWGGAGELEFERIARINTRIGLAGKYITGTMGIRETTIGYLWLRPGMFDDDSVSDSQKDFLRQNFEDGMFAVFSGTEFCCCWSESMDDHLKEQMYTRGFGQSRRAMGTGDLPIQKRINIWADLWDKFIRGAIPMTLLENKAFDPEAISQLESDPRRFVGVALDEGQSMQDVVGMTPAPTPVPGMSEMFQWYVGPLIQSIDGAVPALNGTTEGSEDTWRGQQLRIQQSLERYGPVWGKGNFTIAKACEQAAKCCARNGSDELSDTIPGEGDITVRPSLMKGSFEYFPETHAEIPQSGSQREAKLLQVLDMAQVNPQIASLIGTPSNARAIVEGLDLQDVITVDEANSEDGALEDIETLLSTEPLTNPDYAELSMELERLTSEHQKLQVAAAGLLAQQQPPAEEHIQAGEQMQQQIQQLTQQLQQTPQFLPYVPVSQKDDEDHATIKATVFAWMQEPDGRALRRLAPRDPKAAKKWMNVSLYYDGHSAMAQKLQKAQAPPAKVNLTGKLLPEQQAALLQLQAGIQTDPQAMNAPHEVEETTRLYTPVSEVEQKIKRRRL
jgi:hypothetical protein